jgi:stress-induced-phosphoprotein 1
MAATADEWKQKGNDALREEKFKVAVECYSKGLDIDEHNHVLYSNRSAAYAKLEQYEDALKDAESAIELKPEWSKGYSRMGYALSKLGRFDDAKKAYQEGLKVDPENPQLKDGLVDADKNIMGIIAVQVSCL